ncbi:unnamed protein product [Symbiodinium microadriaticum]|nr:unnamed protein product [Symbiodinium microadriaticum]
MIEELRLWRWTMVGLLIYFGEVEHFYDKMEWETTAGRIYSDAWGLRKLYSYGSQVQKLFKLIRHIRNNSPAPDRKLKGICKMMAARKEEEEGEKVCEEEAEDECFDEAEQGEEEEMEDDECVEVSVKPAPNPRETPVRRLGKKTTSATEDVLCLGETSSKEKLELDSVLEKIQEPVDPPPVDPFMQRQLRTNKKKTLCRGKPKKAGEPKEPKGPKKSVKNEKTKGKQAAAAPKKAAKNGKVQQAKKKPLDDDGGEGRPEGIDSSHLSSTDHGPLHLTGESVSGQLALTLYVAQAMGFTWTAEVPSSCLMDEHQRWQRLGSATKVFRVSFWVRGSQHLRKIRLYSNSKAIVIHRPVAGTKRSSIYAKKRKRHDAFAKIYERMLQHVLHRNRCLSSHA